MAILEVGAHTRWGLLGAARVTLAFRYHGDSATTNYRGAPIFFDQEHFTRDGSLMAAERLDR